MRCSMCFSLCEISFVINITLHPYRLTNKYNATYLPWIEGLTISSGCLPRNLRATSKDWSSASDPSILDGVVRLFTPRTLRLLRNVDELEREVLDSSPSQGSRLSISQGDANELRNELSDEELQRTHQLARSARLNVQRNVITEEFHEACEKRDWNSYRGWKELKEKCRNRHAWGVYFRSELDWDWDLAGSLKSMYKLPRSRSKTNPGPTQQGGEQYPARRACPDSVQPRLQAT